MKRHMIHGPSGLPFTDILNRIKIIAIDGAACSGKTTGMIKVAEWLTQMGYKVYIIPEAATTLLGTGARPGPHLSNLTFQEILLKYAINLEDSVIHLALENPPEQKIVFLCDRGAWDGSIYVDTEEVFISLAERLGYSKHELIGRYHGVFILETAAIDTEFYTLDNNKERTETPEQAIEQHKKLCAVWTGHNHLRVITNKGKTFDQKLEDLFAEICHLLGEPVPIEIEDKFAFDAPPDLSRIPVPYKTVSIKQTYLVSKTGQSMRVRSRTMDGSTLYIQTTKIPHQVGGRTVSIETEQFLSKAEYERLLQFADEGYETIEKQRTLFVWNNQYFELDHFRSPGRHHGKCMLEIELARPDQEVIIPEFLGPCRNVTDDPAWQNKEMARKIGWFQ